MYSQSYAKHNDSHKKKDSKDTVKEKLLDFTNKRQYIISHHAEIPQSLPVETAIYKTGQKRW